MITQTKPAPAQNVLPPSVKIPSHTPEPAAETKPTPPAIEMHEAPYSWNCTAIDQNGFSEMFTVRAISAEGFMARVQMLKSNLLDMGYKPAPVRSASANVSTSAASTSTNETTAAGAPMCGIHGTPMQERTGRNGKFWSCPQKFANGDYCNFKPK